MSWKPAVKDKKLSNCKLKIASAIFSTARNKQQATSNKQQATSNKQQATSNYTYLLINSVNYTLVFFSLLAKNKYQFLQNSKEFCCKKIRSVALFI